MPAGRRRQPGKRFALRVLRCVLWPIAQLSPDSGWARLYDRLCEIDGRRVDSRQVARRRKVSPALAGFIFLMSAAVVVWITDVLRRPPPVPPTLRGASAPPRAR